MGEAAPPAPCRHSRRSPEYCGKTIGVRPRRQPGIPFPSFRSGQGRSIAGVRTAAGCVEFGRFRFGDGCSVSGRMPLIGNGKNRGTPSAVEYSRLRFSIRLRGPEMNCGLEIPDHRKFYEAESILRLTHIEVSRYRMGSMPRFDRRLTTVSPTESASELDTFDCPQIT